MEKQTLTQDRANAIVTSGLTKKFGTLVAVNDLNMEVKYGDVFGFLGPNGSGKTTTIRMLMGLLRPTAGTMCIFGMDNSAHLPEILPHIGAIIESPVYYSYLSGRDNMYTFAMASGMRSSSVTKRRITEVLELVDLSAQAKDACGKYSLGMKQRLAIGMALLNDPELVLLDEPTNGLDPMGVHEIRQMIQRLASMGKTVILSSHILHEVQLVCNRVAILQKGHLLKQGEVRDLLSEGEHLLVRMNTPAEARNAQNCLHQAREHGADWLAQVDIQQDDQQATTLRIDAPARRASEVVALLARQELYLAEIHPELVSLEDIFIELVAPEERQSSMNALAG